MTGVLVKRGPGNLLTKGREPFSALRNEMENWLSNFWDGDVAWYGGNTPLMDLTETDKTVEVRMDLPGVNPKEIEIKLDRGVLTVSGERTEEKEDKGKKIHRIERRTGMFSRAMTMPCAVSEDEVVAEYKDGVLRVTLPKSDEACARKIEVKSKP
jgi:HSP20 family protein